MSKLRAAASRRLRAKGKRVCVDPVDVSAANTCCRCGVTLKRDKSISESVENSKRGDGVKSVSVVVIVVSMMMRLTQILRLIMRVLMMLARNRTQLRKKRGILLINTNN